MRQMRKTDIHEILGISNNLDAQHQTRDLVGMLMTECNVYSFNSHSSRDTFKNALIRELISPRTRLCPAVLAAYVRDADTCIQALYGLARLIRKSRGPPSSILSPSTSASIPQPLSTSVSRAPSAFASAAPTPTPTYTPALTHETGLAITGATFAPTHTYATAAAVAAAPIMAPSNFNFNTMSTNIDTNMDTPQDTPRISSVTPSMTFSTVTQDESTEATTPENDTKCWVPDRTIWFLDLTNNPLARPLEFHLSDLVGLPMVQIAKLLESTWVDSSALLFIRFANALSEGLQVPIFDLPKIEIWMQVDDLLNKASFNMTVPADEGHMEHLEDAFHTILDEAMESAFNGVLPLENSPDAFDITRSILLGE